MVMQEDRSGSEQQPPEYPSAWAASSDGASEQPPRPDVDAGQARPADAYPVPDDADVIGTAPTAGDDEQPTAAYPGTPPAPGPYGPGGGYGYPGAGYQGGGQPGGGQPGGGQPGGGHPGGYPGAGYPGGTPAGGYPGSGYPGGGYPGGGYQDPGYQGGTYQGGGYPGGAYPGGYQGGGYGYGGYPPGDPGYGMPGGYGGPPGGYGQRPKRPNRAITYVLVAALAAGVGAGTVLAMRHNNTNSSSFSLPNGNSGPQANGNGNGGGASKSATQAVINAVSPGIVDVVSTPSYQPGGTLAGTGMVLTSNGLVLTNNHVVEGTSHEQARIADSGRTYGVTVLGTDATDDVALLKLNGASNLKTVPLGDSSTARSGQPVVALGNAEGQDRKPTVVTGTITDTNRSIQASDAGAGTTENLHGMLQTNAPIVEGDSGGALASTDGKVIGMNTAANTGTTGAPSSSQGFAIPINRALSIVRQIESGSNTAPIQQGYPAFLGVTVASSKSGPSTSSDPQQQLKQLQQQARASQSQGLGGLNGNGGGGRGSHGCLSTDQASAPSSVPNISSGVLVGGVLCGTPVDQAGMTSGAVITAIDGNAISSPASLTKDLGSYRPGQTVSVTWVSQHGQHHTTSMKLAPGPAK
ncbi:MAG TPA: trypsin-like peptidase domain-containing protein [Streptosporangiaceae bacterium]|jgi:S1-C subfamily serine protease